MMPKVKGCSVDDCYYNRSQQCLAEAINVGMSHPSCDTFMRAASHISTSGAAGVGACKEQDCRWNRDLLCGAPGINVGHHQEHADCQTFQPK
jgi:hypothetical protein